MCSVLRRVACDVRRLRCWRCQHTAYCTSLYFTVISRCFVVKWTHVTSTDVPYTVNTVQLSVIIMMFQYVKTMTNCFYLVDNGVSMAGNLHFVYMMQHVNVAVADTGRQYSRCFVSAYNDVCSLKCMVLMWSISWIMYLTVQVCIWNVSECIMHKQLLVEFSCTFVVFVNSIVTWNVLRHTV